MSGYSIDLRKRIVTAVEAGQTQGWIAKTFQVSGSGLKGYVARYRASGSVAPTRPHHHSGQVDDNRRAELRAMVADNNSRTLVEYCEEGAGRRGMVVSAPTRCRAFVPFGITRKKDHWSL